MAFPANIDLSSRDGITDSRLSGMSGFSSTGAVAGTGALASISPFALASIYFFIA